MKQGDKFGKLTIVSVGAISVRMVCDCGKAVVRARESVRRSQEKERDMKCKDCYRAIVRKKYPAPRLSSVLPDGWIPKERA